MTAPLMAHRPRAYGGNKPTTGKAKKLNVTRLCAGGLFDDDHMLEALSPASTPPPTSTSTAPREFILPEEDVARSQRGSTIPPAKPTVSSSSVRPRAGGRSGSTGRGRGRGEYYREADGREQAAAEGEDWDHDEAEFYEEMGGWDWGCVAPTLSW